MAYADNVTIVARCSVVGGRCSGCCQCLGRAKRSRHLFSETKGATKIITPNIKDASPATACIQLGNSTLRSADSLCILGVTISADLKWLINEFNVRSSVNKLIGVLNRFGDTLNVNARQRILQAIITPKLAYCVPVWEHLSKKQIEAMNYVIQRAARVVMHNKSACLNQSAHDLTGLMPFNIMAMQRCAITVSALLAHEDASSYLPPLLAEASNQNSGRVTCSIATRYFKLPKYKLESTKKCFNFAAVIYWNSLPTAITTICRHKLIVSKLNNFISILFQRLI